MNNDPQLRRFAHVVAGPRDFVINLVINGTIAWFVFGGREAVPLAGAGSIFDMLLPMSAIESTLTSFFGVLNGTQELRKRPDLASSFRWTNWFIETIKLSLIQGLAGFAVFFAAMYAARGLFPTSTISPRIVPIVVGILSGILALVLHSRAVIQSETIVSRSKS